MKFITTSAFVFFAVLSLGNAAPGIIFADDELQCKAPNGGGLQSVIDEFVKLLPVDKLLEIYITAVSEDPEVQEIMAYLESDDFKQIILAIQNAPQFNRLMAYACEKLYLDVYYYYNKFADLFGLPPVTRPPFKVFKHMQSLSESVLRRPGLKGMLLDMYDVLPMDEIRKMFYDKLENDEYVKLAMEFLASEDFKKIVKLVENVKEFKELLQKLRDMNIDIDEVIRVVKKFFKWD